MDWKVAGEFVSPKNITIGSNSPLLVLKVAFHSLPSLMCTLLYPHLMLNLENNRFPARSWISSVISRSGYLLGIVHLFSRR